MNQRPLVRLLLAIALIGAVIGLNQEFFRSGQREFGPFSGPAWLFGPRTDLWVITQPEYAASPPSDVAPAKVQVVRGTADITEVHEGSDSLVFATQSVDSSELQTSVADFPNWRVRLDGKTISHEHDNPLGIITFNVPPGSHSVELDLEDTAVRTLANYWSLVAWVLFIVSAATLACRTAWSAYSDPRRRATTDPDILASR